MGKSPGLVRGGAKGGGFLNLKDFHKGSKLGRSLVETLAPKAPAL